MILRVSNSHKLLYFIDLSIIALLAIAFPVDMMNGYQTTLVGSSSFSVVHKVVLLSLAIVRITYYNLRASITLLTLFIALTFSAALVMLDHQKFVLLVLDLSYAVKSLLFLTVLEYLRIILRKEPSLHRFMKYALYINIFCILLNSIFGYMGLGFSAYGGEAVGDGIGIKGYIYSANELAATILGVSIVLLANWKSIPFIWRIVLYGLLVMAAVGTATKTATFGLLIALAYSYWVLGSGKKYFKLLIIALACVVIGYEGMSYVSEKQIAKILFILEERGVLSLIFSERDSFALTIFEHMTRSSEFYHWLFGAGRSTLSLHVKESSELDLLDMYFWFGIAGVVIWIRFFLVAFRFVHVIPMDFGKRRIVKHILWLLLIISFFSGHIVYSGVISVPLALALAGLTPKYRKNVSHARKEKISVFI